MDGEVEERFVWNGTNMTGSGRGEVIMTAWFAPLGSYLILHNDAMYISRPDHEHLYKIE